MLRDTVGDSSVASGVHSRRLTNSSSTRRADQLVRPLTGRDLMTFDNDSLMLQVTMLLPGV